MWRVSRRDAGRGSFKTTDGKETKPELVVKPSPFPWSEPLEGLLPAVPVPVTGRSWLSFVCVLCGLSSADIECVLESLAVW